jgi:hypothetical protein
MLDASGELRAVRDGAADVEEVDAGLLQFRRDLARCGEVVPLVAQKLLGREADAKREPSSADRSDARDDLQQKPQAVLETAAVLVVAPVEIG